eukprot:scaffold8271_cov171-Amphora_coffeaeformis.AAC.5
MLRGCRAPLSFTTSFRVKCSLWDQLSFPPTSCRRLRTVSYETKVLQERCVMLSFLWRSTR